jgi:hypothetical protein
MTDMNPRDLRAMSETFKEQQREIANEALLGSFHAQIACRRIAMYANDLAVYYERKAAEDG